MRPNTGPISAGRGQVLDWEEARTREDAMTTTSGNTSGFEKSSVQKNSAQKNSFQEHIDSPGPASGLPTVRLLIVERQPLGDREAALRNPEADLVSIGEYRNWDNGMDPIKRWFHARYVGTADIPSVKPALDPAHAPLPH